MFKIRWNGILSKLRPFAPLKTRLSVHYSIFILAWPYAKEINIDQVNKLQKRCIWILTFSHFNSHTIDPFEKLKMLKAQDVFTLNKLIFTFDYIKGCIPDEVKRLLTFSVLICNELPWKFYIPQENTTQFSINTLSFDGAKLWYLKKILHSLVLIH